MRRHNALHRRAWVLGLISVYYLSHKVCFCILYRYRYRNILFLFFNSYMACTVLYTRLNINLFKTLIYSTLSYNYKSLIDIKNFAPINQKVNTREKVCWHMCRKKLAQLWKFVVTAVKDFYFFTKKNLLLKPLKKVSNKYCFYKAYKTKKAGNRTFPADVIW